MFKTETLWVHHAIKGRGNAKIFFIAGSKIFFARYYNNNILRSSHQPSFSGISQGFREIKSLCLILFSRDINKLFSFCFLFFFFCIYVNWMNLKIWAFRAMWFYRNNSDKFEGCTLWWSKRDHWKVGIFPRILTTLYELSPAKKILRNLQTKDFFVKKWQKIEGFPFQVMKKKHHDFTFCLHFLFWHFNFMSAHSTIFVSMTTTSSLVFTTTHTLLIIIIIIFVG